MQVSKTSVLSNKVNVMKLPLKSEEYVLGMEKWLKKDVLIQDAFPTLNATQREFLMTGMDEEEQSQVFKDLEGDDNDYLIICDERNNTPDIIDSNELRVDIYLKPTRATAVRMNIKHGDKVSVEKEK